MPTIVGFFPFAIYKGVRMTITAQYLVRRRSEQARVAKQYAQMRHGSD